MSAPFSFAIISTRSRRLPTGNTQVMGRYSKPDNGENSAFYQRQIAAAKGCDFLRTA